MALDENKKPVPAGQDTGQRLDTAPEVLLENEQAKINFVNNDEQASLKPNPDAAIRFLQKWKPEGPWVLTALATDKKSIETRTFDASQLSEMAKWIDRYNSLRNLYFHVNTARTWLNKKAERQDIQSLDWLHVDIDPRPGENIEEERKRALSMLQNPPQGIPKPSVIIFSGGGYQGFWKLQKPLPIDGNLTKAEEAKLYNMQLELIFGADNCHNIDRIMRLPGTVNIPDEKKLKKGRIPTLSYLVAEHTDWSRVYDLENFQTPKNIESKSVPSICLDGIEPNAVQSLDALQNWHVPQAILDLIANGREEHHKSRSEPVFRVACELVRLGVPDASILGIFLNRQFKISESILEKGGKAEDYARRQVERAKDASLSAFVSDKNGKPYSDNQNNIRLALTKLGVAVRYDKFQDRLIIEGLDGFGPLLDDDAMVRLWLTIDEYFHFRPSKDFFWSVVQDGARNNCFHPVLDYLDQIQWDEIPRIIAGFPHMEEPTTTSIRAQ